MITNEIQCNHVFLIIQFPEPSNLKQSREISRAYQSSQKIFRVRRPFFNPPWSQSCPVRTPVYTPTYRLLCSGSSDRDSWTITIIVYSDTLGTKDACALVLCLEDVFFRTRPQRKQKWRYNFCWCTHASFALTCLETTDPGWSSHVAENNMQKQ